MPNQCDNIFILYPSDQHTHHDCIVVFNSIFLLNKQFISAIEVGHAKAQLDQLCGMTQLQAQLDIGFMGCAGAHSVNIL